MKKSTSRKKRNLLQSIFYAIYIFVSWIVNKIKGIRFSKKIVILVIAMNIAFTLEMISIFKTYGAIPESLVVAWFGFTTVEVWGLSKIKRNKDTIASQDSSDDYLGG